MDRATLLTYEATAAGGVLAASRVLDDMPEQLEHEDLEQSSRRPAQALSLWATSEDATLVVIEKPHPRRETLERIADRPLEEGGREPHGVILRLTRPRHTGVRPVDFSRIVAVAYAAPGGMEIADRSGSPAILFQRFVDHPDWGGFALRLAARDDVGSKRGVVRSPASRCVAEAGVVAQHAQRLRTWGRDAVPLTLYRRGIERADVEDVEGALVVEHRVDVVDIELAEPEIGFATSRVILARPESIALLIRRPEISGGARPRVA